MYAVILAGGGGTRLWPLSDPERPKPFLPLLADGCAAAAHASAGWPAPGLRSCPTTTSSSSPTGAMRGWCAARLPGVPVIEEPMGRNTAAAVALATLAIERPEEDVMIVLPADHLMPRRGHSAQCSRGAGELARGALGIEDAARHAGRRAHLPGDRLRIPGARRRRGARRRGLARPTRSTPSWKSRPSSGRSSCWRSTGVAWNAGIFIWRRRAIRAACERYTPLVTHARAGARQPTRLARAYEGLEALLDRLRGHGARRQRRPGGHGAHERWLERPRQLDRARRMRWRVAAGAAGSCRPASRSTRACDDLVVERIGRPAGVSDVGAAVLSPRGRSAFLAGARQHAPRDRRARCVAVYEDRQA